jgi:TRAP-type C4-dicarboxylate transport system permease large subunit
VLFFRVALDARLDEHWAPVLLPVILLLLLAYDRWAVRGLSQRAGEASRPLGLVGAATEATRETVTHIGALLTLMGLSVGLGGVVERSDLMSVMPDQFGSPWGAMAAFVVILVLVGMTMDPYGAVILVSATLPRLAEQSGIDPGHFWMVVLVAFELGYLTPPVALNHLLTRQVVGPEEVAADAETSGNFWARHERLLLPVTVIGVVLLLVAFVPLMVGTTSAAGNG